MTVKQVLAIVELRTKIVSASTWLFAVLYSAWRGWTIDPWLATITYVAALAIDMGTTAFNTYFDWYRNVDDPRFNRETDKVLVHDGVSPGAALKVAAACFFFAAVSGGWLSIMTTPLVALIGSVCLLVGFLYSGGPKPISGTPFGEIFAGGFLGTAFFAISVFIMAGRVDARALLASAPQALFIGAILAVNNACDLEGDTAAGRRTLAIALGKRRAPLAIYTLAGGAVIALCGLSAIGLMPASCLFAGAALAIVLPSAFIRMRRRGFSHATKRRNMNAIARAFLLWSVAMWVGIVAELVK